MFGYSGMDLHTLSGCVCVCVCTSEKVSHSLHSVCGRHGSQQETACEFLCSWARSPWQFSLSSCVATPFFKRQTSSWTTTKSGQKEHRNFRSLVYFSLSVLGLLPHFVKAAQQSELRHHISLRLAKLPLPKTTVKWLPVCLTFALQL